MFKVCAALGEIIDGFSLAKELFGNEEEGKTLWNYEWFTFSSPVGCDLYIFSVQGGAKGDKSQTIPLCLHPRCL